MGGLKVSDLENSYVISSTIVVEFSKSKYTNKLLLVSVNAKSIWECVLDLGDTFVNDTEISQKTSRKGFKGHFYGY